MHWKIKHRKIKIAAAGLLSTAAAVSACTLTGAGAAYAGTNGQQVYINNGYSSVVCFNGTNQYGQDIGECSSSGQFQIGGLYNWWWVGWVFITGNDGSRKWCLVPQNQDNSDWYNCGDLF